MNPLSAFCCFITQYLKRFIIVYFKAEQVNLAKRTFRNAEHLKQVGRDYVKQYILSRYRQERPRNQTYTQYCIRKGRTKCRQKFGKLVRNVAKKLKNLSSILNGAKLQYFFCSFDRDCFVFINDTVIYILIFFQIRATATKFKKRRTSDVEEPSRGRSVTHTQSSDSHIVK